MTTYPGVPMNFPVSPILSGLAGAQPKMSLVEEDGAYYQVGTSPSEVLEDFLVCEDLAHQLVTYCQRKESEGQLTRPEVLLRAFQKIQGAGWCKSDERVSWTIERARELLQWPEEMLSG